MCYTILIYSASIEFLISQGKLFGFSILPLVLFLFTSNVKMHTVVHVEGFA